MGVFIGAGLAFMVGGAVVQAVATLPPIDVPWLGEVGAWRIAFLIVGVPGILLSFVILRLREPQRTDLLRTAEGAPAMLSIAEVIREVGRRWRPVAGITLGMACHAVCMYGVFAWTPGQAGMMIGAIVLFGGCAGMAIGGAWSDRWRANGAADAPLRVAVIAALIASISGAGAFTIATPAGAVALLVPTIMALALPIGSVFASMQMIFSNQVRGQASALFLCLISLIGISLGPLLPAWLNDNRFGGGAGIGLALAFTVGGAALGMALLFRATWSAYRAYHQGHVLAR
jgi:MFS family permease